MKTFFNPSSIAVVGASTRKGGYQILKNLLYGYTGAIYGVNPGHREIEGVPCYPSVEAIPYPVDLAILLVPAPVVPAVLEGCARKEIKRVMVESAGFAEVGEEGRAIQERALAVARGSGLRIWGPNCMGLVDVQRNFFFTFMSPYIYEDGLLPGRISLIAQSGMLSAGFLADLQRKRLRIGKVCSIGNKADVDECDLLEYLIDDPDTDAVALYLESLPRGRLFADLASGSTKPIVVLKGGKSEEGARAAMSHTSSLAGNSRLFDSILDMSGVTLASDFHQMIDLARALSENPPIPPPWRVAVLTFSGGAGILSCDLMARHGLRVARFSGPTKKALDELFPRWMPASNPVDLYPAMEIHGNIETYQRALAVVMEDPNVDVVFIHYVPGIDPNTLDLEILKKEADRARKKVVFWLLGRDAPTRAFQKRAEEVGLLFYDEISRALECVAAAARFQAETRPLRNFPRDSLSGFVEEASEVIIDPSSHGSVWDEYDSKRLLERASIPVVQERLVFDPEEALAAAVSLGFPVVLKGLMPGDVHKTEHGLVRLGIDSRERLQSSFEELSAKLKEKGRILLQRQATVDYELIAGFVRDDQFGPCVMFGLGGIFSELQRDVVFAAAPLTRGEALKLIRKIKGRRLLEGFRGMAPLDENLMAEILVNLGNLGAGNPVEQIDINPLIVHKGVPLAVDATVILTKT